MHTAGLVKLEANTSSYMLSKRMQRFQNIRAHPGKKETTDGSYSHVNFQCTFPEVVKFQMVGPRSCKICGPSFQKWAYHPRLNVLLTVVAFFSVVHDQGNENVLCNCYGKLSFLSHANLVFLVMQPFLVIYHFRKYTATEKWTSKPYQTVISFLPR